MTEWRAIPGFDGWYEVSSYKPFHLGDRVEAVVE